MSKYDLVVRNGTVVTAADTAICDVGVVNGVIVAMAQRLPEGRVDIDARNKLVIPGGVDAHVHLDEPPFFDAYLNDDFRTGTTAAAHGGTTSIVTFAHQRKGEPIRAALDDYHKKSDGHAVIDYGFHVILTDPDANTLGQELPGLVADGYTSYKCFMSYDGALDDGQILATLEAAKREGALVMIHAENEHCIKHLAHKLSADGKASLDRFPKMAPMPVEREATHRAITLSEVVDAQILLVHVSAREAMEQIRWGRERGLKVYAETCPQYLVLDDAVYDNVDEWEAAKYLCSPPPRDRKNPDALWRGIAGGVFDIVSSDHNAFQFSGHSGKRIAGDKPHFRKVPPGIPGIEARMALTFSKGVSDGRIDLNRFVALTATNPAKIYGLYPRKGTIAIGSDADLVLWNPDTSMTISHDVLHEDVDYTPYEGVEVRGWPELVVSRGDVIVRDGTYVGGEGRGKFLRRQRMAADAAA